MSSTILLGLFLTSTLVSSTTVRTSTPVLGWNSYNYYNCYPNETIIKTNAQGLVNLGFDKAGYNYLTVDCGWNANYRDSSGQLVWNPTLFPAGGPALGEYIHGLGLKFGVYSGGGIYQCGSTDQPASLGECKMTRIFQVLTFGIDLTPVVLLFQATRRQMPSLSLLGVPILSSESRCCPKALGSPSKSKTGMTTASPTLPQRQQTTTIPSPRVPRNSV